jgi:hypothetical protein
MHGQFFNSNGGRSACDQCKATLIDNRILCAGGCLQIQSQKPRSALRSRYCLPCGFMGGPQVCGTFQCWGRLLKIELIINKVISQVINNLSIEIFF